MELPQHWPLPEAADLRDALVAAYADPSRHYHDRRHLAEVLERLDELVLAEVDFDRTAVTLAAWFHDAVYDGERDAEERSAAWAEDALAGHCPAETVAEVARLVRMTEHHDPAEDDAGGCALSDADLGILAAGAERYADYAAAVRAEYDHLTEDEFRLGRAVVLRGLLERERLFQTAYARREWEAVARANIVRELASLEAEVANR
jgi:predicted metal-dependent HD superfamily phosphohydrolase